MRAGGDTSTSGMFAADAVSQRRSSYEVRGLVRLLVSIGLFATASTAGAEEPRPQPAPAPVESSPIQQYENEFFDSDGVRLRFIDEGAGEPVVLIHGFALNLEINWVQPDIVAALIRAGYRVIAYDFRGHGASEKPHESVMYGPAEVGDPIRLLDHLGIERAHVVGYSRGAMIAHRVRARHPERLLSVVLGGYTETEAGPPMSEEVIEQLAPAMAGGDYRPLVRTVAPALGPPEVEQWHQLLAQVNDGEALAAAFRAGATFQPLSAVELGENEIATLAIVGENDFFLAGLSQMASLTQRLETLVIPDADHATAIARPEFVTAVLGFLGKHGLLERHPGAGNK